MQQEEKEEKEKKVKKLPKQLAKKESVGFGEAGRPKSSAQLLACIVQQNDTIISLLKEISTTLSVDTVAQRPASKEPQPIKSTEKKPVKKESKTFIYRFDAAVTAEKKGVTSVTQKKKKDVCTSLLDENSVGEEDPFAGIHIHEDDIPSK